MYGTKDDSIIVFFEDQEEAPSYCFRLSKLQKIKRRSGLVFFKCEWNSKCDCNYLFLKHSFFLLESYHCISFTLAALCIKTEIFSRCIVTKGKEWFCFLSSLFCICMSWTSEEALRRKWIHSEFQLNSESSLERNPEFNIVK